MAPRAFWKGYLKFSLVSCAVAMAPATSDRDKVRFHTLNAKTGHRVQSRYVDAETGDPVEDDDQVRAYPVAEDRFVVIEDDELDAVALESTRTIDIETFVPRDSIGWIWLDRPHFLTPDDKPGEEAFAVIREAMRATGTVGIARVVLYRRERAVMVEPCGRGIVAWTLRFGDEVRDAAEAIKAPAGAELDPATLDPATLDLVSRLIEARKTKWSPAMAKDPVQEALVATIEGKKKAPKARRAKGPGPGAEPAGNVVSIMDALRRSVEGEKSGKKR